MKTTRCLLALSLLFPACGHPATSSEPAAIGPEPVVTEDITAVQAPQLLLLHACAGGDCVVAARSPARATALCHGGKRLPSCPVSVIAWPPGFTSPPAGEALSPRGHERVAVSARWSDEGALAVLDVLTRAGEGALEERLFRVSPGQCDALSCASLRVSPLDGRRGWMAPWLDLSRAPDDDVLRNEALVEAHEPGGLLAVGKRGASRSARLDASDFFVRAPPSLCGDELRAAIAEAAEGMLWPSESDFPIAPLVTEPGAPEIDDDALRALAGVSAEARVEARGLSSFAWNGRNEEGMEPEERAEAARFRRLRAVLERSTTDLAAYHLGEIEVRVLVVGRTRCGEIAGVSTTAIET